MFRPATETFTDKLTIYLGDNPVEIIAAWPAHTLGDVYVYFPKQRAVATGDLYLTNSVPAMDQGSAAHWIQDLDQILALPADHFVPGHFEVGTRQTIQRFRDYMNDLNTQVVALAKSRRHRRRNPPKNSAAAILRFPPIRKIRSHLRRQCRGNPQTNPQREVTQSHIFRHRVRPTKANKVN